MYWRMRSLTSRFVGILAALAVTSAAYAQDVDRLVAAQMHDDERLLVQALETVSEGGLDEALAEVEALVKRNPTFRLAQLVYADLLTAKGTGIAGFGGALSADKTARDVLSELGDEARIRLERHRGEHPPSETALPGSLLKLGDQHRLAVVVDISLSRMYLLRKEGGTLKHDRDFYVSTGKNGPLKIREGDQKTPLGVYFVTSRIDSDELPDFYGTGAFPVNYPNEWDRLLGRTGYGIWIHGVPTDTYSRPPRASDGCMALSNDHMSELFDNLRMRNTPVIITNSVDWIEPDEIASRRQRFLSRLDRWRTDWESLDHDSYTAHYADEFRSGDGKDYATWVSYKQNVNSSKKFIRIELSDVSVFAYPAEQNMFVVNFRQDYESDNLKNRVRKRQYWRQQDDGNWQIVYEGVASDSAPAEFPFSARSRLSKLETDPATDTR